MNYSSRDLQDVLKLALKAEREEKLARKLQLAFLAGKQAEAMRHSQYSSKSILDELLKHYDFPADWMGSKGIDLDSLSMARAVCGLSDGEKLLANS